MLYSTITLCFILNFIFIISEENVYTVGKLAKISGVSIRSLHYYDEIDLLKPDYRQNGYRYYKKEQLLILQQILFFKELGFELEKIKEILEKDDFNKIDALQSHRKILEQNIKRTKNLLKTIDNTIDHLERKKIMQDQEIFWGFEKEKQKEYEEYLVKKYGKQTEDKIMESHKNTKNWKKEDWDKVKVEYDSIYKELVKAIEKKVKPDSTEVQKLIQNYFQIISKFYKPTKETFIGLGQMYLEHPDFRKLYDKYHPDLAKYLAQAMKVYAEKSL